MLGTSAGSLTSSELQQQKWNSMNLGKGVRPQGRVRSLFTLHCTGRLSWGYRSHQELLVLVDYAALVLSPSPPACFRRRS